MAQTVKIGGYLNKQRLLRPGQVVKLSTSPLLKGLVGVAGDLAVGRRSSGVCGEIDDVLGVMKVSGGLVMEV